jgi:hypothetical protein
MKRTFILLAGFVLTAPAYAQGVSYPGPQAEVSEGAMNSSAIAPPSLAQRREALAAAKLPAPNGSGNVVPNGPVTANPPGAGASSSATLAEHGEVAANGGASASP